jgi:predicted transcriptional regulator
MNSHPVASSLKEGLSGVDLSDMDAVIDSVLQTLDSEKLLYYADPGRLPVLNNHGRVLVAILEDPGITQRALSVYLRVSESNVQKSLKLLLKDGIIKKKRSGNRNSYEFDRDAGLQHPDVKRVLQTLLPLVSER